MRVSQSALKIPAINKHHLFQGLPHQIERNPKWRHHLREGKKGRGYWFWKPTLVKYLISLGSIRHGDIVVWADADAWQDGAFKMKADMWSQALEAISGGVDVFAKSEPCQQGDSPMGVPCCEYEWTKQNIFSHFGKSWDDPHYGLTSQVHAELLVLNINERTRAFLDKWEDMNAQWQLLSEEKSSEKDNPHFKEHRHDQSILSMLVKANRPSIVPKFGRSLGRFDQDLVLQSNACAKKANRSELWRENATRDWVRHPTFGISGLTTKWGALKDFAVRLPPNVPRKNFLLAGRGHHGHLERHVFIGGDWFDLEAVETLDALESPGYFASTGDDDEGEITGMVRVIGMEESL
jgi:hypothetical protein